MVWVRIPLKRPNTSWKVGLLMMSTSRWWWRNARCLQPSILKISISLGGIYIYRCFPHQIGGDVCRKNLYFDRFRGENSTPKMLLGGSGLLLAWVGVLHRFDRGVFLFPRTDVFATHGYPKITNWTNLGSGVETTTKTRMLQNQYGIPTSSTFCPIKLPSIFAPIPGPHIKTPRW